MLARSLTHSHHIYLLQALSEAAGRARPLRHLSRLPPRRALRHQRQRRPDHQGVGVPLSEGGSVTISVESGRILGPTLLTVRLKICLETHF